MKGDDGIQSFNSRQPFSNHPFLEKGDSRRDEKITKWFGNVYTNLDDKETKKKFPKFHRWKVFFRQRRESVCAYMRACVCVYSEVEENQREKKSIPNQIMRANSKLN